MKNQVKVSQTQPYKDSQVEAIVCKGKLVLIWDDFKSKFSKEIAESFDSFGWAPIIISETEEIEVGDKYFVNNTINESAFGEIEKGDYKDCRKILALPKNFSPKQLQAIVDGKLKDESEVFIECICGCGLSGRRVHHEDGDYVEHKMGCEYKNNSAMRIKLNKHNHITLFPVKKEESWNNVIKFYFESKDRISMDYIEFANYLKETYNPPTKK